MMNTHVAAGWRMAAGDLIRQGMNNHWARVRTACISVCATMVWTVLALPLGADGGAQQRDADSLSNKLISMLQHAEKASGESRLTPVTEAEVNAFLSLSSQLPVGVTEPQLTMVGDGQVAARATVDLDAVRRARQSQDWLDLSRWLTGRVPVEVRGLLKAQQGWARFELQAAEVAGLPIPKALLQEVVSYYSRSQEFPSGVDLDAPFQLPARISEIRVDPHQAVIVQR
jgi:hypothetical protein